ncbi:signal peptide peptidase SppA [Sphingomonas donggukensis]|uniref:Signal peptide peptidase SppA n=1 Tax=Sphingomonas donggukensis TaxID=2949093 RepID=A0ABY4TTW3_9SPHN|nr:signal peptide peptidase SppA [Sphingomonas donggukensis]URW75768.1 signal peptide peptidase SppA [Sphingomonas donggukensis]
MKLVRGAWKLLVGIKDFLVLAFMLLFFGVLFAALNARPNARAIKDGALLVALDGRLVEQPQEVDPFAGIGGGEVLREIRARDVVRALDTARTDTRVKAVVLDLDRFAGGYPSTVAEVADAVGRVRASGKPVLAYATGYMDASYLLAANASEVWVNPMGGTLFMGPGGSQLYYKGLIDKLGVNVHVYRVGQFKSAVEPYTLTGQSEPARAANVALYGAIFERWKENVAKARPKARIADVIARPGAVTVAAGGDLAKMNLAYGLVDKLGDRVAFGKRVAEIAGHDATKPAGSFNAIRLADWIGANPVPTTGDAIGVITVAGEIVDGKAGPGTAGGASVSKLLLDGLAKKSLKALVVRVDSPGGSALASEEIRQAVLQAKAKGLPVVVSMGGLAASGGYWVATAGDTIFAEPNTITGSIGIFGILPSFENALAKIGVTADGVATTPLSGQPDVFKGFSPELDAVIQSGIEQGYRRFITLVAGARKMTPERVNEIGQGRVWDGGTARQIGLVDRFGGLPDAIAEAARRAKLDPAKVHAVYLDKEPSWTAKLAESWAAPEEEDDRVDQAGLDPISRIAADRRAVFAQAIADARRLATGSAVQVRCLECAALAPPSAKMSDLSLADLLYAKLFG